MNEPQTKLPFLLYFFFFSFCFSGSVFAQPADPVGLDARITPPTAGSGEIFLAAGPNNVGAINIVYRLFYSTTASAPADPKTATPYVFGSTAGDGGGTAAFGFMLSGLTPSTSYTFWLYQYNTVTMQYSANPATDTQISGAAPSGPTTNLANPTCPSANVINIYGDAYMTNIATEYNPNWGQSGFCCVNPAFNPGTGNTVLAYTSFNYQGTLLNQTNASSMTYLNFDIWTNANTEATTIQVSPINTGTGPAEVLVTVPYTQGGWTRVSLPKSAFTGMTWDGVFQLKFAANGPGSTVPVDIYLDNIYFSNCAPATPTTNLPNPTCPEANVINIYGGAYPTSIATNYNPNWGQSGFCCVNPSFNPGTGNSVLAYTGFNYQGTLLNQTNASSMTYLNFDIWTNANPAATTIQVSPINKVTGPAEVLVTVPYIQGGWTRVSLPKSAFTGMTWDGVFQLKFAANRPGSTVPVDIYLDNIYFSTCAPTTPITNLPQPTCPAANVINIYGGAYPTTIATEYNPNWGQSGFCCVNSAFNPGTGNTVLAYTNFNYQGTLLTPTNASSMAYLNFDIWTNANPAATTIQVSPINNGTGPAEVLVTVPYTQGGWTRVSLPKSAFTGMTWNSVFQLKFAANGPGSTVPVDIYLDNIYFSTSACSSTGTACKGTLTNTVQGSLGSGFTYEFISSGTDVTVNVELLDAQSGLVAFIQTMNPGFAEVQMTNTGGQKFTRTFTSQTPGAAFNFAIKFAWAAGGIAVSSPLAFKVGDCPAAIPTSPSTAAPVPPCPAANVMSVFSDLYTNIAGTNLNPGWGQATVVTQVPVAGNNTLVYTGLNYQGIQLGSAQNLTGKTHLHLDYWSTNSTSLKVYLISPGPVETAFTLTVPTSGWSSVDIPLSTFSPVNLSNVIQLKFDGNGTIYLDNIYFTNCIPAPEVAAPTPTCAAGNCISMFSNAYTNVPVDTWRTSWSSATLKDTTIAGNDTKKYTNLDYVGIETTGANLLNLTNMTFIHLDYWTPNMTTFRVKLVDFGPNGIFQGSPNDDREHEIVISNPSLFTWNSLDIPLSAFTGLSSRAKIAQLIISGLPAGQGTVFIDNVYFSTAACVKTSLSCDHKNISVDQNCSFSTSVLLPGLFHNARIRPFQGTLFLQSGTSLSATNQLILGTQKTNITTISRSVMKLLLGKKHIYEIEFVGNSCWGTVAFEDKMAPSIMCLPPTTVQCDSAALYLISDIKGTVLKRPTKMGNCGFTADSLLVVHDLRKDCGGMIIRSWSYTDCGGMVVSCKDTIVIAPMAKDRVMKPDTNKLEIACSNPANLSPTPAVLFAAVKAKMYADSLARRCGTTAPPCGLTTTQLDGISGWADSTANKAVFFWFKDVALTKYSSRAEGVCGMISTYKDMTIKDDCCEKKVMRTTTLLDWCNGKIYEHTHIILITDKVKPSKPVVTPSTITVNVNPWGCTANALLPAATITDNCDAAPTVSIVDRAGVIVVPSNRRVTLE
ncbi:MAG: hypothetical protein IPJ13_26860 [Saprospiraceae bacterium]|nr:hypothetical protein [Saprospiraceae bacterium]